MKNNGKQIREDCTVDTQIGYAELGRRCWRVALRVVALYRLFFVLRTRPPCTHTDKFAEAALFVALVFFDAHFEVELGERFGAFALLARRRTDRTDRDLVRFRLCTLLDGLLFRREKLWTVTPFGSYFVRNDKILLIAYAFDVVRC